MCRSLRGLCPTSEEGTPLLRARHAAPHPQLEALAPHILPIGDTHPCFSVGEEGQGQPPLSSSSPRLTPYPRPLVLDGPQVPAATILDRRRDFHLLLPRCPVGSAETVPPTTLPVAASGLIPHVVLHIVAHATGQAEAPCLPSCGLGEDHPAASLGGGGPSCGLGEDHPAASLGEDHPEASLEEDHPAAFLGEDCPAAWGRTTLQPSWGRAVLQPGGGLQTSREEVERGRWREQIDRGAEATRRSRERRRKSILVPLSCLAHRRAALLGVLAWNLLQFSDGLS